MFRQVAKVGGVGSVEIEGKSINWSIPGHSEAKQGGREKFNCKSERPHHEG